MNTEIQDIAVIATGAHPPVSSHKAKKSKRARAQLRSRRQAEQAKKARENAHTTAATEMTETSGMPFRFLDLPYEIRLMIYELCFARKVCIVPAVNFYRRRPNTRKDGYTGGWIKYSAYQYQWSGYPQNLPQRGNSDKLPHRDGSTQQLHTSWISNPTDKQIALIVSEVEIPDTCNVSAEIKITHTAYYDYNYESMKIMNRQTYYISGLFGVKLLRACKQLRAEGSKVLYGYNTFELTSMYSQFQGSLYNEPSNDVPGLQLGDGTYPTSAQLSESISTIFDKKRRHPEFIWNNPLTKFLTKIGQYNAGLLRSIGVNGCFKTVRSSNFDFSHMSLADTLPIYSLVLRESCRNLKKVTIDARKGDGRWPGFYHGHPEDSDEAIIDDIVGMFAENLPHMSQLCLGSRGVFHGREMVPAEWARAGDEMVFGRALRWEDIVARRQEDVTHRMATSPATVEGL